MITIQKETPKTFEIAYEEDGCCTVGRYCKTRMSRLEATRMGEEDEYVIYPMERTNGMSWRLTKSELNRLGITNINDWYEEMMKYGCLGDA